MSKELKIVFYTLVIYGVLSIQFLFEQGIFIIPYMFNPLVIFGVSLTILFFSSKKKSFSLNLIYFIGTTIYCFTSERTLNILFNYTKVNAFIEIIENPYLRLTSILGFSLSILSILILYSLKIKKGILPLIFLLISTAVGLIGYFEVIYVIGFTLFVISFFFINFFLKNNDVKSAFFPSIYQLILFVIIENIFFILI